MATYTDANGVKLITTGDEAGTWGSSTNVNLQILDRAANGFESIALSSTTYTLALSAQPSSAENGHYKAIKFTGSPGGTCTVTLDQNDKARVYMILNSTNQALIITQGSGGNVTLEVGKGAIVLADGAGSGAAVTDFTAAVQNVTDLSSPFNVGATSVTTSGAELNLLDGSAAGTIANSKAVIYGSSGEVNATTLQIAGTSITATAAELNYVDGVTSAIQTQIDSKQATITGAATTIDDADLTASRAVISNASGKVAVSAVTDTELGYLDGVTSAVQTQIDSKQATITGAATTIDDADLTASRVLVSNSSGKVAVSSTTTTELGSFIDGSSLNASNLDSGTVNDARLPASISSDITGNAATATTAGALTGDVTKTGDFTVDATGDIILDADGNDFKFKNGAGGDTATLSFADTAALKLSNTQATTVETTASGADIKLTTLNRSGGVKIHSNASSTYNMSLVYGNASNKAALSSTGGLLVSSEEILFETSTGEVTVDADLLINESLILTEGTQNWTVTASGTNLTFAYNGVNKMRIDSSGNLTVTGNVTTNGTL